ncbi:ribulose-1,5 bisphosphate carboxylase oxygenase large subunit N- chloroplastic isoform X1 [Chlorella sorokiniana]|uniref:Ribulose-1,5 bisphosphate carboxylase oxygenase large subunit N-chloroplastic isoform X1 n=1 Tax=Chlorella sorokiniana TaxID=3076 RepID=A0A2P6TXJ3_CHLSO|nr:ribulose-1,5 bisphosphate carboxylase oxygenase large subunit N- chloroplastic isoform X1 [Chlorella sorokiniana]|eukprot:PRW58784.1 ribulose-1,5 bisphosphate carboxylase oxygenase large subunit N- chloroplastic isoform X1 [Chlorella sorokiniana]
MSASQALRWGAGACAASLGLALHVARGDGGGAQCLAAEQTAAAAAAAAKREVELAALAAWLQQQGADIDAISIKESETDAGRYGVYANATTLQRAARSWAGTVAGWAGFGRSTPVAVAAFPLDSTLTAANLARHPRQGAMLRELMELGVADERVAVILHLAVERRRQLAQRGGGGGSGGPSPLEPWLALLPDAFSTTQYFSELELQWLRGTTLHKATRLRQKGLREAWMRLEPVARQLSEAEGAPPATLEDWVWANSLFWSRAISFPTPNPEGGQRVVMQEGIVPGLDVCNHSGTSACKWTVFGAEAAAGGKRLRRGEQPDAVSLVCPRRGVPRPGSEITINYGDKSNEELLFLYGFAVQDNPHEVLTLMCPLPPPAEWDGLLEARLLLLQRRGLRPQLHLPAADLSRLGAGEDAKAAAAAKAGRVASSDEVLASDLPDHVLEILEVFVMEPAQVAAELEAPEASSSSASSASASASSSSSGAGAAAVGGKKGEAEASGRRMALLTTLVRLLELKALEMEDGVEGTGPLEADQELLAAAGEALPRNQRHALLYRMGQKALARAYLVHAKKLLQREMAHLAALQ